MKVRDAMVKKIYFARPDMSLKDTVSLIFGRTHTGVPVVEGKNRKLVGFITDTDILSKCYPSMKEYVEDSVHAGDFSQMEKRVKQIMSLKVKDVMNKSVVMINEDQPILKAESIMKTKDIARLPVTDKDGNLIGIIRKKDIFRALIGKYI